jgi:hypothetical protein
LAFRPLQLTAAQLLVLAACYVLWHRLCCPRRRRQWHRLTCQRMTRIAAHWLPSPKLRHHWWFDVMTRGRSPVR